MRTLDFAVRLDDIILGCATGTDGNTPEELQLEMINAIKALNKDGVLYNIIMGRKNELS